MSFGNEIDQKQAFRFDAFLFCDPKVDVRSSKHLSLIELRCTSTPSEIESGKKFRQHVYLQQMSRVHSKCENENLCTIYYT